MANLKQQKHNHVQQWGLRIGTEVLASTMIGLGIGFFLDHWLGTRPLFLIIFAIFGCAAGFITLYQFMVIDMQKTTPDDES